MGFCRAFCRFLPTACHIRTRFTLGCLGIENPLPVHPPICSPKREVSPWRTSTTIQAGRGGRGPSGPTISAQSIVVFLVALPLCIGIAVASGLDPAAGIISGIVGGIVVGALGGSALQVSGPAAGLTLIVWQLVHEHGAAALAAALLIAGVVQIVGRIAACRPLFSGGVSVGRRRDAGGHRIVDRRQPDAPADGPGAQSSTITSLLTMPAAAADSLRNIPDATHTQAIIVAICTLVAMAVWQRVAVGRLRLFPAALAGVVVGAIVAACAGWNIRFITIPENFAQAVQLPGVDLWQHLTNGQVIWAGVGIALVASTSSMLCAASIDKFHSGPRHATTIANWPRKASAT